MGASSDSRIVRVAPLLLSLCIVGLPVRAEYNDGEGTAEAPYCLATTQDITHLSDTPADWDKHFVLVNDIDLSRSLAGGRVFDRAVIAPDNSANEYGFQGPAFTGTFDGNGHVIRRLAISGGSFVGLFGKLGADAQVRNLGIVDASVNGTGWGVGILAGQNSGNVVRCYSSGNIHGDWCVGGLAGDSDGKVIYCYSTAATEGRESVGGLVGDNGQGGIVAHCCSTGPVDGQSYVGGLVGSNWACVFNSYSTGKAGGYAFAGGLAGLNTGTILNCYCTGEVGGYDCIGGLAGANYTGSIANSYSTGSVGGQRHMGGLIGDHDDGTITNSFWNIETSGLSRSSDGTGLATAQMQDIRTYEEAGWDLVGRSEDGTCEVWQIPPAGGYPALAVFHGYAPPQLQGHGTSLEPFRISSSVELGAAYYHDPSAHYRLAAPIDLAGIRWSTAVVPCFAGILDGNDMTISNLTVRGGACLGLFGCLEHSAEVRNVALTDVEVAGSGPCVGGLAGENDGGRVIGCSSSGTIHGTYYVGGLLGDSTGAVDNSHGGGQVSGLMHLGGLAGHNGGRVTGSLSTAAVKGEQDIGGLVAYNTGDIYRSHSAGVVHGANDVGGLVGENYAEIRQSHSTVAVEGREEVGGLVGRNAGSITASFNSGSVTGKLDVGGLVGDNSGGIFACSAGGPVCGQENVGGLVGHNCGEDDVSGPAGHHDSYSSILSSCSTGPVRGDTRTGGLVGTNAGIVVNSYSAGNVGSGWRAVGGLIGYNGWPGSVSGCFWDKNASGQSTSDGGTGLTTARMQDRQTFLQAGWDLLGETANGLHETWQMPAAGGYPIPSILNGWQPAMLPGQGTPDDPYLISTATQLASLAYNSLSDCYVLTADIDLSSVTWSTAVIPQFRGVFDGSGRAIHNLTISGIGYLGLFARLTDGAEVRNLAVLDAHIQGTGSRIGLLAGHNLESRIIDCRSTGEVGGYDCIGGLVGSNYWGAVTNGGSDVVASGYSLVGGLVGDNAGVVSKSHSSGRVKADHHAGGLIGLNEGISLSTSYSTVEVSGRTSIGGLTGSNWFGDIADCYSTGAAAGSESVGGLIGRNTGAVTRCYSTGVPTGDVDVGGFAGDNRGGITASFWDIETSGRTNMCGAQDDPAFGCDEASGRTTAEMQTAATFLDAGWDFAGETANGTEDLWWLLNHHDYPRLFWQLPVGTLAQQP